MAALYLSPDGSGNDRVVARPRRTDAIGAALRGVYGGGAAITADLERLVRLLDRTR